MRRSSWASARVPAGRDQHEALDALAYGIKAAHRWILDCDIRSFFDEVNRSWLIRFVEHRIGDRRIVRLIPKWLTAGVLEGGHLIVTEEGTPQGAVIRPLLANIYLDYVYDLWARAWRKRCATGDIVVVRYADDTIVGFEHQGEAELFLSDLKARFTRFGLDLDPDKTRLIAFGRSALRPAGPGARQARDVRLPRFTHYCAPSKRLGLPAQEENDGQRWVQSFGDQGHSWPSATRTESRADGSAGSAQLDCLLCRSDDLSAISALRHHAKVRWFPELAATGPEAPRLTWRRMNVIVKRHLPVPGVLHPWPEQRFLVKHPR